MTAITTILVINTATRLGTLLGADRIEVEHGSKINGVSWVLVLTLPGDTRPERIRLGFTKAEALATLDALIEGVHLAHVVGARP